MDNKKEAKLKGQDAVGLLGLVLAVATMTDMPIHFRLACFAAGALFMPISFFSHKDWLPLVKWGLSILVVLFMGFAGYHAWAASRPKKDVFLEWKQPSPMEFGTALSNIQLNAVAKRDGVEVKGEYLYNPTRGSTLPAGMDTLSVEFTPRDLSLYLPAKETIAVQVKEKVKETEITSPTRQPTGHEKVVPQQNSQASKKQECAPGSICNQDSPNNGTQTVNNGPPPLKIKWSSKEASGNDLWKFEKLVTVTANVEWHPIAVAIHCDGEVKSAMPEGTFYNLRTGFDPTKTVISLYFANPPQAADTPLTFEVFSDQEFKVLDVKLTNPPPTQPQ